MDLLVNIYTPSGIFIVFLLLGVVFVNGWTDAPNAISSSVVSKALSFRTCALLCGVFNLIGVVISPIFAKGVSENVFSLVSVENEKMSSIVVISTLLTAILYGVIAWLFGMPSSESHAMLCGLMGAGTFFGTNSLFSNVAMVFLYLGFSILLSLLFSFIFAIAMKSKSISFKGIQALSLCTLSLMHGCQDGQKFVGIFKVFMGKSDTSQGFFVNSSIILSVACFMLLGSLLGGGRIVSTFKDTTKRQCSASLLSSDLGSILTIFICSLFGMPISTGTVKLFSLVGAGYACGERINKKVTVTTLIVALATFPICFIMGYGLAFALNKFF